MGQAELEGMPEPAVLRLRTSDGQVLVTWGNSLVYRYEVDDAGMRNLAIIALTDAGRRVDEVARVFGLTATYVSILRGRARARGSAGLVRRRGRPPKLTDKQVAKARGWAAAGWTQQAIADRLGVAQSVISELLARLGPAPVQQMLPEPDDTAPSEPSEPSEATPAEPADIEPADIEAAGAPASPFAGSARIQDGTRSCRYAGAMLLYPYLERVGAETIFATLAGGPARRYGDLGVLTTATLGFALGAGTVEGTKHLRRAEAGAAVGLATIPELATLRARLGALADSSDPLALQRAFAAGMLAMDPAPDPVYFVDEHFVPYAGARPVAKGWNTKRRHAQPGRDDTLLVDARGRAVVFGSGEPSGLAATLPAVLAQLRAVLGPHAPILLGFDRGGAYPVAFTACRDAGADWVTYRRAPLVEATATPRRSWTVRDGRRVSMVLADETIQVKGYGDARQLTLFEHDQPVLQVLTSHTTGTGADLVCWLRARWRIENMFKYAAAHNGIDALACSAWKSARTPGWSPTRPGHRTQSGDRSRGRARHRRTCPAPASGRAGDPQAEERRHGRRSPADREGHHCRAGGQDRAAPRPGQGRGHPTRPGRETSPSTPAAPRPTDGPAATRVQRRSLARRALQRLPGRPRRVPRHHPQPAPPGRARPLQRDPGHHHPRPARQPPSRPRPPTTHRRAERHTSDHPRGERRPLTYQVADA